METFQICSTIGRTYCCLSPSTKGLQWKVTTQARVLFKLVDLNLMKVFINIPHPTLFDIKTNQLS